jgi:hypothetical protein
MMIPFRRRPTPLFPFTVTAVSRDRRPTRIGILARSTTDALRTARELFPDHLITAAALEPQWQEGPA